MKTDPRSCEVQRNYMQLCKEAWKKIQDFNGVCTHDLAIPVWHSNQLSYEATDVGSRSIVGSYVPVKVKNVVQTPLKSWNFFRLQFQFQFQFIFWPFHKR